MDENYWLTDECAEAFWDQHKARPYQQLLADTLAWAAPKAGERWLDLGCGGGYLTAGLWRASQGQVSQIVAQDCAEANALALARRIRRMSPAPRIGQITFQVGNFSQGLPELPDASFDGIVSGLAMSYAESRDATGRYTDAAYNQLFRECVRVLRPTGRLVFSVNVPNPRFWRIVWKSLGSGFKLRHPKRTLGNVWRMQRYGKWLKQEAARGRFHFLPLDQITRRLAAAGFASWRSRLSYADQAYLIEAQMAQTALAAA
ncbi:MAG TPA: class I SAM-dependent methyltransferase [Gemmatales bacterium]|nr:class I SAM-dependent methyltransferase [Gemmatales bacterium]HMP58913.1 class I SAM-dependent methyltransferase [Gemmatales bacterium]